MRPDRDLRLAAPVVALWGAALVVLWGRTVPGIALATLAATALALVAALAGAQAARGARARVVVTAVLLAAAVGGVASALELHRRDSSPVADLASERAVVEVHGLVRGDVRRVRGGFAEDGAAEHRLELALRTVEGRGSRLRTPARVEVRGGPDLAGLQDGSQVVLGGRLAPGEPTRPAVAVLEGARVVAVTAPPGGLTAVTGGTRAALLEVVGPLPQDLRGLVVGAAVGDTRSIPDDLLEDMRTSGLAHVTAVSGAHVAVLQLSVTAAAAAVGVRRRGVVVVTAVVLTAFVLLVRPGPTVLRAAAMGTVVLVAGWSGRRSQAAPALAASVGVLLVLDPWLAVSLGFALSVVATAAIVLLAPPLAAALTPRRAPGVVGQVLAVPLAAQAACAPLLLVVEPTVSGWAVLANVLAAPALPPATLLGVSTAALAPAWPQGAHVTAWLAAAPAWWVGAVARWCAGLPGAQVPWREGAAGAALLVLVTAAVLAVLLLRPLGTAAAGRPGGRTGRARWRAGTAVVLVVCLAAVPEVRAALRTLLPEPRVRPDWAVVACDVGQGDALVVRSGPRSAVVIDVGPLGDSAARCLRRLGVDRVDLLVLTHHHADHDGGLAPVLRSARVVQALVPAAGQPAGAAGATTDALTRSGVAVGRAADGAAGQAGAVRWQVLWPAPGDVGVGEEAVNDGSTVVALEVQGLRLVALGDLGARAQDALAGRMRARLDGGPGVEVVKMAHHGSADQSPVLARVLRPRLTLVSAGRDNTYGHPTRSAVDLYEGLGSTVRSTHACGDVVVLAREAGPALAGCVGASWQS